MSFAREAVVVGSEEPKSDSEFVSVEERWVGDAVCLNREARITIVAWRLNEPLLRRGLFI